MILQLAKLFKNRTREKLVINRNNKNCTNKIHASVIFKTL